MARLVTCGFELNSTTNGHEAAVSGLSGGSISSSTKRSGSYAYRVSSLSSGTPQFHDFTFTATATTGPYYARAYVYFATFPSAANRCLLFPAGAFVSIDNTGILALSDSSGSIGSASNALSLNTWYRLELEYNAANGAGSDIVRLYVDGVEVVGSTTRSLTGTVSIFTVGGNQLGEANTTGDWFFDDIAVNDSTGSAQTGLPGAGSVCYLRPNGAGDADTGSPTRGGADSGTIQGQIDETTPNDATDYVVLPANPSDFWVDVEAGSVGGIGVNDAITLVEVNARVSAVSATSSNWFPQIKKAPSGTIASASAITWASASWFTNDDTAGNRQCKLVRYLDPDNQAWTPSTIDTLQVSARTTDGNPDTWVSATWAIVEYVPAAPVIPFTPLFIRGRDSQAARLRRRTPLRKRRDHEVVAPLAAA